MERFSETARDFVRGALNKIPNMRPTYAMLLRHPWLTPLLKPPTIAEEDEDATGGAGVHDVSRPNTFDEEVSRWVNNALERKRNGKMGKKVRPALHAAPLDATSNLV